MKKIILASNSPRRKEILTKANIDFTVVKSDYKEDAPEIYREDIIKKNSLFKALDAAKRVDYPAIVIGADTMVILREGLDSVCLLKPASKSEAFLMLKKLSGRTHKVVTSISLAECLGNFKTGQQLTEIEETFVTFRKLSDDEIKEYIEKFNPLDKAGSYGIQDFITEDEVKNPPGTSFIKEIQGDYYNVMGISISKLKDMLEKFNTGCCNVKKY